METFSYIPVNSLIHFWKRFQKPGSVYFLGLIVFFSTLDVVVSQDKTHLENDILFTQLASAQDKSNTNLLSIEFTNVFLQEALELLAERINVGFSYNPDIIPDKRVTFSMRNVPVHEVIYRLLEGTNLEPVLPPSKDVIVIREKEVFPAVDALQQTITGEVVDSQTGEALPGATVVLAGTDAERGTTTDIDGRFELEVPSMNETLMISYVGYASIQIQTDGQTEIYVELTPSVIEGSDVVVTALGLDREARSLGYSISEVTPADVTINRTPNFMDALSGKMAGVNVTTMSGAGPQGSSKVRIRGQSSFGANNSPLIVVDGVPIDNTSFGVSGDFSERGSNRNSDSGDGLSSINPDNIAEMTVLKGASAAALYGARAKDGVIMITTKNGSAAQGIQVELNSNFTFERPIDRRDYQFEYGQGEGGERPTSPFPDSGVWSFGEKIEPGMTQILFDGLEVPYEAQRNQLREYYDNGTNFNNSVTVSQGGQSGGFSLSASNLNSQSILPGSSYKRNSVSLGFNQTIAEKLTVSGNINYSNEDRQNPPNIAEQDYSPVVIYTLSSTMPMDILKENAFDENGNEVRWSRFTNRTNPYFALSRFENNKRDRVYGNLTARYELTDWLFAQGRIGQDYFSRDQEYNLPTGSQRQPPAPDGFVNGQFVRDHITSREVNADILINATQHFGNYRVDLMGGGNLMWRRSDRDNALVNDFYSRGVYSIGNGRSVNAEHSISERKVNSIYGSAEFSYAGMVYLTGTLRNDWFSTLSPDERSILYPSVTTSFIFTDAFKMPEWITSGKVRASYAEVGSDTDVPPFAGNLFYGINPNQFNGVSLGGISGGQVPNTGLRPMRVSEWEFGLEMTLFNNLFFEFAYYDKTSKDQILAQQIPNSSGFTSRLINIGESNNKGVEMLVNVSPIQRSRFTWDLNFNAAYNKSKVIDLGSDVGVDEITVGSSDFHGELRQVTGKPMNQLYGWGWLRDEQGRQVFADDGRPIRSENQLNFGSSIPIWVGGISNSFNYRGVSMSFLIDFKLGHKLISGTHTNAYRHGMDKATLVGREQGYVVGDGVSLDGSVNTAQAPIQPFYETLRANRIAEESVFNAGSWQLRQITLGYNFTSLANSLGFRGLRANIVANNVAVLKSWVPHIHPDQNGIYSDRRQGLESTGLPVTTGIGFNLNIQI